MKKKLILIFVVLFLLLVKIDVNAECTNDELQVLKIEAQNIISKVNLGDFDEDTGSYLYDLYLYNVSANLHAFGTADKNDTVFVKNALEEGRRVNIKVYGSDISKCPNILLRDIYIDVPYYNKYSEYNECSNYKNYDICKENSNTKNISEEEFLKTIDKIKKQEEEKKQTESQNQNEKNEIIEFFQENKEIIIISIVGVILIIIILVIAIKAKNKNKITINLDGEL